MLPLHNEKIKDISNMVMSQAYKLLFWSQNINTLFVNFLSIPNVPYLFITFKGKV